MPEKQPEMTFNQRINLTLAILGLFAEVPILFLRHSMGAKAINGRTLIGVALFVLFVGQADPVSATIGFWLILAALVFHKFRRTEGAHSRYDGRPWLMSIFPKADEMEVKSGWEPAFLGVAAFLCLWWSPPLSLYLFLGALGIGLGCEAYRIRMEAKVRAIEDARYEAEVIRTLYERRNP